MASNVPTTKQIAWISLIPHFLIMGFIIYLYALLAFDDPFLFGALTYVVISYALRNIVAKNHRQGIRLVKQQKFSEAIPAFEKSVRYFSDNSWVDKYRFLTLLSSSNMTYKEMGLCNIAFCYSQTGNGLKAKDYYEQTLKEFPANGLAIAGLNMLNSAMQITE
jgi:tetratricopeptide (TPR) repeat protein